MRMECSTATDQIDRTLNIAAQGRHVDHDPRLLESLETLETASKRRSLDLLARLWNFEKIKDVRELRKLYAA
jgi:hypothetical protein